MAPSTSALDVFKPPWYQVEEIGDLDMNICSIIFGSSISLAAFVAVKAFHQTVRSWRRNKRVTSYVAMIWAVWVSNIICALLDWLNLWGTIPPSFWLSLSTVVLWAVTVQLITQIILNRISLLVYDRRRIRKLKWGAFVFLLILNFAVAIVWLPASLQISDTWIKTHAIWDRIKQVILGLLDLAANWYFLHVVRSQLISNGLTKYTTLFWNNVIMIIVALALDIAFICLMSLPASIAPYQFQQIVYLARLYIEMNNADLVIRIVQATDSTSNNLANSYVMDTIPISSNWSYHDRPRPSAVSDPRCSNSKGREDIERSVPEIDRD